MNETIRHLISEGAAVGEIRDAALAAGTRTLREEGQHLVEAGMTNEVEVERVVQVVA
jgi:type II secretory ATPase GspE/PulE/Tfp pilus assembly ATPase PilB-like protein